jgi:hypothetical protein
VDEALKGGGRAGATRRGDVVVRPATPWTPAVVALLRHLQSGGYRYAPRVADTDEAAREEALVFIEGSPAPERWTDDAITEVGAALRQLHDATAAFTPPPGAVWQGDWWVRYAGPDSVIGHGDPAPWNILVRGEMPVAFVDWEFAGPVHRLQEVAHAAWLNCQLHDDDVAERRGLLPSARRALQLRLFLDGYGLIREERWGFIDRLVEVAVLSAANEAIGGRVTPETSDAGALWGITWRVRGAAWILRNRGLLESYL